MPRRLRFACEMIEGESIVGAVFRSASRHGLTSIYPVLGEVGISRKAVKFIQLLPNEQLAGIAEVIRCDPARLGRDAGVRQGNAAPDERGRQRIRFGGLEIEGCHLDHVTRRFSPGSLAASSYHRSDWLNRLLPYCPFSFELLTVECPACRERLGWTKPFGIEFCENCEYDLRNSSPPDLDPSLRRDYRAFADLFSLEEHRRQAALVSLPPAIRKAPAGTLVRTALHIGQFACESESVPETHLHRLPPTDLARIVSTGWRSLVEWPDSFQTWVANEANDRRGDRSRYSALKRSLRLFARRIEEEPGGRKVIKGLLPEFAKGAPGAPVTIGTHYSAAETQRRLHADHVRIKTLCEKGFVETSVFRREDGTVSRRLLDARRVDQIAIDLDRAVHLWEFWKAFRLPSYAVEQLICLGVIQGFTDPAIVTLRSEALVPRTELDRLAQMIGRRARKGSPPPSAKSLRVLSHEINGRLKPWGAIWKGLVDGELPFWTRRNGRSTQHILVEPAVFQKFSAQIFDKGAFPDFPFKTSMNNCDLSEVLNLQPRETIAIREAGLITSRAYKLSLRHKVSDVLDLAFNFVSLTELMRRSKQGRKVVLQRLRDHGVVSRSCLWERWAAETAVLERSM